MFLLRKVGGDAVVNDAHVAALVNENICGLKVAVNELVQVHVLATKQDLREEKPNSVVREPGLLHLPRFKLCSVNEGHD